MKTPAYLVLMSLALLFDGRAETLTFDKVSNEIDLSLSIAGAAAKGR